MGEYYKRIGGSHYRREKGAMVRYGPGEIVWMEEWEIKHFKNVFEMVDRKTGRAAMRKRGLDPDEVEGQVSKPPPPPPPPPIEEAEEPPVVEEEQVITAEETVEETPPPVGLELAPKGGGWYDVVNTATGKPINDKAMRHAEAIALVDAHEAGGSEGEQEAEAATATEANPVDGAEAVAEEDGFSPRRGTESEASGGGAAEA